MKREEFDKINERLNDMIDFPDRASAMREVRRLRKEVERLKEYEWKYKELCK